MTTEDAIDIVELLLAAFPSVRQRMTEEQIAAMGAAYYAGLVDIGRAAAKLAVNRVVKTSKFLPSIAEIRAAVVENETGTVRPGGDAWGEVKRMRTFRDEAAMATFDPIAVQICKSFDWIEWRILHRGGAEIRQWHVVTTENDEANRARFIELYDKTVATARKETAVAAGARSLPALPPSGANGIALGDVVQRLLPREERDEVMRCETHREGART